jgi:type VI secretion system protein ImpL
MDRALGGLARTLGLANRVLPPARSSGRSYFVNRLLREVIIGEAGLAGTNRQWERRRARLHGAFLAATALVSASTLAVAWQAYSGNQQWLGSAAARAQALAPRLAAARAAGPTDPGAMLPLLDDVYAMGSQSKPASAANAGPMRLLNLGLDQQGPIAAVADDAYDHLLRDALLPRLAARLAERLQGGHADHVERVYEALKTYLMMFGGKNFDAAALRAYFTAEWNATPALLGAVRDSMRSHIERLLATGEVGAPSRADAGLIEASRRLVAGVALRDRVYNRLKQTGLDDSTAPASLEAAGGPGAAKLLLRASGWPPMCLRCIRAACRPRR